MVERNCMVNKTMVKHNLSVRRSQPFVRPFVVNFITGSTMHIMYHVILVILNCAHNIFNIICMCMELHVGLLYSEGSSV